MVDSIEKPHERLHLEIRPFSLTKRQVLIDRLLYDLKILETAEAHAKEKGIPRNIVMAEVERFAKEIVPSFNAYIYFRVGSWLPHKTAARPCSGGAGGPERGRAGPGGP